MGKGGIRLDQRPISEEGLIRAGLIYLIIPFGLLGASWLKNKQKTKEALKATLKILYTIKPGLILQTRALKQG